MSPRILEIKKRKRKILRNKIIFFFVLFLIFFILLAFLSRWEKLQIVDIQIQGNKIVEEEWIRQTVEEELQGHYLFVFPKKNILIYPRNKIIVSLGEKYTRLEDINLSLKDQGLLLIETSERKPTYTWCGDMPLVYEKEIDIEVESTNNIKQLKCYFLDERGYVFDQAPYFSGDVYFRFFGKIEREDVETPVGNYFLPENFGSTLFFIDNIKNINLKPYALYVKEDGQMELYLASLISNNIPPKIILKTDADLIKMVENLEASLVTEPLRTKYKENFANLEYIDLRFGNKVYYKFNDE